MFDDAGIGSTGTDSLASAATNITPAMASAYTYRSFIIKHKLHFLLDAVLHKFKLFVGCCHVQKYYFVGCCPAIFCEILSCIKIILLLDAVLHKFKFFVRCYHA